jgi:outer membrane lipoprotein-sorting protein
LRFLRTTSTTRLLALVLAVIAGCAATAAIAIAATSGGGSKPPPKPLADAVHQALAAPTVDGVSARIAFTNHLVDSSVIPGATPLLTGATGRLWASPDGRLRIELQSDRGDAQIVKNGNRFLVYDGSSDTAYEGELPGASPPHSGGAPPSLADVEKSIAQVRQHAGLSGAIPTTVAGQSAYELRVTPRRGGLVSQLRAAWDAVRGVPLKLALYARGNGSPVLALTVTKISYGPVAASTFAITPPAGAKVVDLTTGTKSPADSPRRGAAVTGLRAVQKALPFTLAAPARLAGKSRGRVALIGHRGSAAVVTYGQGLDGLAVIEQKADGQSRTGPGGRGGGIPTVSINGATGQELPTVLGTVVRFSRGGVEYTVLGSQPSGVVLAAARAL